MKLTIWGARGSIPVSGAEVVRYGGDTTCAALETGRGLIVLDMGTGARALGASLVEKGGPENIDVLLTHAHWDHLQGFPFFAPLYRSGVKIRVHGCSHVNRPVRSLFARTMEPPFFPVDLSQIAAQLDFVGDCRQRFDVAGLSCQRFQMNHPNGGCGLRLGDGRRSLVFLPDNELGGDHPGGRSFEATAEFCRGADVLMHDGEYYPAEYESTYRGWGHSPFTDAVRLAVEAGVGRLMLWHHKPDRTDEQVDAMVEEARRVLAQSGVDIACEAAGTGRVLEL